MISEQAFDVLRTTSLFAGFTDEQLAVVPKVALPRAFEPGTVIVTEGSPANSMFLIVEGEVEVRVGGRTHRTMGPGNHFGEMALLTDMPRAADVVARTSTTALELSRRHLEGLIASSPRAAVDMLAELARRLRAATEALAAMMETSAESAAEARRRGLRQATDGGPDLGAIAYVVGRTDDR